MQDSSLRNEERPHEAGWQHSLSVRSNRRAAHFEIYERELCAAPQILRETAQAGESGIDLTQNDLLPVECDPSFHVELQS